MTLYSTVDRKRFTFYNIYIKTELGSMQETADVLFTFYNIYIKTGYSGKLRPKNYQFTFYNIYIKTYFLLNLYK